MVRKATLSDIDRILEIYTLAKHFMHTHGNPNQWNGAYPERATLKNDVENGYLYVMHDENGCIYGCFALIGGVDPTYIHIDGSWHSDTPYGTIHRIAGDGTRRGIFAECCTFARTLFNHLRVDTHEDNKPMQNAVTRDGFKYAGIIYLADGEPRMAYDWVKSEE